MIKINNLVKEYKDFNLNISMEIPAGQITGLIGKNGAGKSTVIKSILGLINPTSGEVYVMGTPANKLSGEEKQKLGIALADSGFSSYLKVSDVKSILKKSYTEFDENRFAAACRSMGLPENKPIKEFSTGMKAKLRVLTALSHNAKLLIMDEPTAGMDVEARNEILDILRDYLAEDEERTILVTSHIATDLEGLCDDVYLINGGRILLHEDTDRILSDYAILKMDESTYGKLLAEKEQEYFLRVKKANYGYECLTAEKQYFLENYPGLTVEAAGIDDLILMMTSK